MKPKRQQYEIPEELFANAKLSWSETILLSEIDRLDFGNGFRKSTVYLQEMMGYKHPQTVLNEIYKLRKQKYLRKDQLSVNWPKIKHEDK